MPWITDANGDKKYIPSIYAKEELPTWNEIYNEFYKQHAYVYSYTDMKHLKRDPYWKIPHQKYLLAVVCNQFNKMIFEDGMGERLIKYVKRILSPRVRYVGFVLETDNGHNPIITDPYSPPPIYTIPLPTGEPNPFITSDVERIDIAAIKGTNLFLVPWIGYDTSGDFKVPSLTMNFLDKVIDFMMKDIKKYFEGEGVGWKDEDGRLIELAESGQQWRVYEHNEPTKPMCESGTDPAL